MSNLIKKEAVILFFGDIFFFVFSLWFSLYLRFAEFPTWSVFEIHFTPFSILFAVWFLIYFISGLYDKHTLILKSKLPSIIFNAQIVNTIFAVVFFYTIPILVLLRKQFCLFIFLFLLFVYFFGDCMETYFSVRNKSNPLY